MAVMKPALKIPAIASQEVIVTIIAIKQIHKELNLIITFLFFL